MDTFLFFLGLILLAAGITGLVKFNKRKGFTVALLVAAVVSILLASTTVIAPRTVGIVVTFGKPVSSLGNGIHWKAPWSNVEKLDGAVQNDVYNNEYSIKVRLGNDSEAYADASIQWQLRSEDAMGVFLDYRTFENIQQNLVDRNFRAAMNEVMRGYDPLDAQVPDKEETDLTTLSADVLTRMQDKVGDQITVKSVTIPIINFNEETQALINEYQSEVARTRIAKQKLETAKEESKANKALESSLSEEILVSKCLDIISLSGHAPIGCFPGSDVQPYMQVGNETPTVPATTN